MSTRSFDRLAPYALLILRLVVGITFFLLGLQKFQNLTGVAGFFGSLGIPLPGVMAPFIAVLETLGGLLLIFGIATRWVSILFIIQMIVSTLLVKLSMGWAAPSNQPGVGMEFDLLMLAGALILVVYGAGGISVDRFLRGQPALADRL